MVYRFDYSSNGRKLTSVTTTRCPRSFNVWYMPITFLSRRCRWFELKPPQAFQSPGGLLYMVWYILLRRCAVSCELFGPMTWLRWWVSSMQFYETFFRPLYSLWTYSMRGDSIGDFSRHFDVVAGRPTSSQKTMAFISPITISSLKPTPSDTIIWLTGQGWGAMKPQTPKEQ